VHSLAFEVYVNTFTAYDVSNIALEPDTVIKPFTGNAVTCSVRTELEPTWYSIYPEKSIMPVVLLVVITSLKFLDIGTQ